MMRTKSVLAPILLIFALTIPSSLVIAAAPGPAGAPQSDRFGNADYITVDQLRDYLTFVASDEMQGRDTPSAGLDIVAKFIATNLARWGLEPAGDDGTFFQKIELQRSLIDPAGSSVKLGDRAFSYGEDFLASTQAGSATGGVVYAAHGWIIPPQEINPYEGLDVEGKFVVVAGGLPPGVSFMDLRRGTPGEDFIMPQMYLREHGALGMIMIPDFRTLTRWEASVERALERGAVEVTAFSEEGTEGGSPFLSITPSLAMLDALFRGEQMNASRVFAATGGGDDMGEPFALDADKMLTVEIATQVETTYTQNVVAIQRGADPELADHYVALGAHYDHVGVGTPVNGDAIYNGADDDGSGTVALLAMAEAFAKGPAPQRSIIFVWHAGEEHGLWGARYFNEHLPIPADNVVSQLNIDMIGRSKAEGDTVRANADLTGPNEVYLIGPKVMSDQLGEIAESVNDSYLQLDFNYMYDAVDHPTRFFFRSDHVQYARNGIPIIFFFTGTHEDYHRPSDEVDKIDFQKMEKISRTIYALAWALAHGEGRPAINENLPPELIQQ
jgi:hypothetical protein